MSSAIDVPRAGALGSATDAQLTSLVRQGSPEAFTALYLRHRAAAHKRLVMLATLELVTAGVSRLPIVESWGPVGFFAVTDLFLLAMIVYDWKALGRMHIATLLGGAFLIASQPLRLILGATGIWTAFATWLVA